MAVNQFVEYPKIFQAAPQIFGIETHILLKTAQFCNVKHARMFGPGPRKGLTGRIILLGKPQIWQVIILSVEHGEAL